MIEDARGTFGGSTCKIDRDKALDILDEMKQKFPVELEQARMVMAQRTEYLNQAQTDAERLRSETQEETERLLREAHEEADRLIRNAREEAAHMVESSEIKRRLDAMLQQRMEQYRKEMEEQKRKDEEAARDRLARTERQCSELRKAVDSYCSDALRRVEDTLAGALGDVRKAHSGFVKLSGTGDSAQQVQNGPYDAAADTE